MIRMASAFKYHDQFFYVSNRTFFRLIDFTLEVGSRIAETDLERSFVSGLRKRSEAFYPGYDLAIERDFPTRDERKFWARVFFDLAYLIFRREIGMSAVTQTDPSRVGMEGFKLTHLERGQRLQIFGQSLRMCGHYGQQTQGARTTGNQAFKRAGLGDPTDRPRTGLEPQYRPRLRPHTAAG